MSDLFGMFLQYETKDEHKLISRSQVSPSPWPTLTDVLHTMRLQFCVFCITTNGLGTTLYQVTRISILCQSRISVDKIFESKDLLSLHLRALEKHGKSRELYELYTDGNVTKVGRPFRKDWRHGHIQDNQELHRNRACDRNQG